MYELPMMKYQKKSSQKFMRTQSLSLKKIKTVMIAAVISMSTLARGRT